MADTFDPIRGISLVEKLSGKENWRKWKSDIRTLLKPHGSWKWVSAEESLPSDEKERTVAQAKLSVAAYCIEMTCDQDNRQLIEDKGLAVDMYNTLKLHYEGDTPAKRMELRRALYRIEHNASAPVIQFINNIRTIVNDLTALKHGPKSDEIRDIVLMNLDSSFQVIQTILASEDKNNGVEWTLESLGTRLTTFESSLPNRSTSSPEFSHIAHSSGRNPRLHRSRSGDNWGNVKKIPGACGRCGHGGHVADTCFRDMPEWVKDRIRHPGESANIVSLTSSSAQSTGQLSLSSLRSTLDSGNTVVFYSDSGIVTRGDDLVGKIHYTDHGFLVEPYHIKASYAHADGPFS